MDNFADDDGASVACLDDDKVYRWDEAVNSWVAKD